MAKRKWTYEEIEAAIIGFIERKAAVGCEDVFPTGVSLTHSNNLPSKGDIRKVTGMSPTAFYRFLFDEGKIQYEYKPKKISPAISPKKDSGLSDSIGINQHLWHSSIKKRR